MLEGGAVINATPSDDGSDPRPQLDPAAAILPGRADSARLIAVHLVRRSFFSMLFVGFTVGVIINAATPEASTLDLDASSPDKVIGGLFTSFALVFVALVLRLATRWIGLALAYPVAREYQANRPLPMRSRRSMSALFDRVLVAQALRTFRWTVHVRVAALDRLGATGQRLARVERVVGLVNAVAGVAGVVALIAFGATIEI